MPAQALSAQSPRRRGAAQRLSRASYRCSTPVAASNRSAAATEIGNALAQYPGVTDVHDLHVWTITSGFPSLSAHVLVRPGDDCHAIRRQLESLLAERLQIDHTTLQVDHQPERLLHIGEPQASDAH